MFQCFYHAWSFDSEGELVGLPGREAYWANRDLAELALRPVARVDSYRGFRVRLLRPDAAPLVDYLADARDYLDLGTSRRIYRRPGGKRRALSTLAA